MISIMFFKDFLKAMSVTLVYNYHPIVKHTLFTLYTSHYLHCTHQQYSVPVKP